MSKLSKLKVGVDVPWVTSWSDEAVLGVRPCSTVNGSLAVFQEENPGAGRPQYSRNHMRRQRLSVRDMLCPMCGAPTHSGDRWLQTARFTYAGELRARNLGHLLPPDITDGRRLLNAGSIAPLHLACAQRSVMHCPHLRGMEDTELKAFPRTWFVTPLLIEARPPSLAIALAPPASVPVISFLQLCGVTDDNGDGSRQPDLGAKGGQRPPSRN